MEKEIQRIKTAVAGEKEMSYKEEEAFEEGKNSQIDDEIEFLNGVNLIIDATFGVENSYYEMKGLLEGRLKQLQEQKK